MTRRRLPNRRAATTMNVEHAGVRFCMTIGRFDNGDVGEIFLSADYANSTFDAFIGDAAILVSLLLQHGCSLREVTHALKRDSFGLAASPIGAALDRIAPPGAVK